MRVRVTEIKRQLERGLHALSALALGDPSWTLGQIASLEALLQPLLHSPLVGEGAAFEAQEAVARSLPGQLRQQSILVAGALRAVQLHQSGRPFIFRVDYNRRLFLAFSSENILVHPAGKS